MKKWTALLLSALMVFGLAACGRQDDGGQADVQDPSSQPDEEPGESPVPHPGTEAGKALVVYYSATGNTESVANYIAQAVGGELFKLEPVEEYSSGDLHLPRQHGGYLRVCGTYRAKRGKSWH